jgi:thioredoxin reductase (NADPH)
MSMIDYDARPVTPQIVLVGHRASAVGYSIRDFLSRNGVPYEWVDVDDTERVAGLLTVPETDLDQLPVCILPNGMRLAPATLEGVAAGLGMVSAPTLSEYDLTIVGAGPAGLAAAVYAASEGLRVVAVESVAPGGQAGTTSMIENYLGFPQGISGSELATRAAAQARRFGAEVLLARRLADITREGPGYVACLSDGTTVRSRAMLLASGVEWRRLEVPGIDELLGSGVYYGAGPSEAVTCTGCRVAQHIKYREQSLPWSTSAPLQVRREVGAPCFTAVAQIGHELRPYTLTSVCACSAGATRVPRSSMARISVACGSAARSI